MSAFVDDKTLIAHGEAFLDRTLPKTHWTHEGHVAAALYILRRRSDLTAEVDLPDLIRRYNEINCIANTDTTGYHETLTQAHVQVIRRQIAARPSHEPLHVTLAALMAGPLGDKNWPLTHWSHEVLFSLEARKFWVEPDLKPL
jgi:hypothetical protein